MHIIRIRQTNNMSFIRIMPIKATKCDNLFLITDHESEVIEKDGYTIQVIPIWEWLTREA